MDLTFPQGLNILDFTPEGDVPSGDAPPTAPVADTPAVAPTAPDVPPATDSAPVPDAPTATPSSDDVEVPHEVDPETLRKASAGVRYKNSRLKADYAEERRKNAELTETVAELPGLVEKVSSLENKLENAELAAEFGCDPKMLAPLGGTREEKKAWLANFTMSPASTSAPAEEQAPPPTPEPAVKPVVTEIPDVDTGRPSPASKSDETSGMTLKEQIAHAASKL